MPARIVVVPERSAAPASRFCTASAGRGAFMCRRSRRSERPNAAPIPTADAAASTPGRIATPRRHEWQSSRSSGVGRFGRTKATQGDAHKVRGHLGNDDPRTKEAANCGGLAGLTKAVRLAVQSGQRRLLYKDGGLKPCFRHSQKVTAISIGLSSLSPRQALVRVLAVFMCRHDVFPCSAPFFRL
jgi:hypothetical protein